MKRRDFLTLVGGLAAAGPLSARAQPAAQQSGKMPSVGYLWHAGNPKEESPYFEALQEGFARLGYQDGRNIRLIHRFPNEQPDQFRRMAAELVEQNIDVLMGGAIASGYLRDATSRIPIVFMFVPDPAGMKFVQSLARPGGNMTGLSNYGLEIAGKRLQLLKELVPGLTTAALLINSAQETARLYVENNRAAAAQLGLELQVFDARAMDEMEPVFDAIAKAGIRGMTVAQGGTAFQGRFVIPKLALARRIALCVFSRETFEPGALVSYGPDQIEMCRRSALYADKILKGAKPSEIPVEQPTTFELFINLQTAKALGLNVPMQLQQIADAVVE